MEVEFARLHAFNLSREEMLTEAHGILGRVEVDHQSFAVVEDHVRLALDVIRMSHRQELDVAVILSQDQDLSEVAAEIRAIAHEQNRWIKVASAFPVSPTSRNRRGIDRTDWLQIDRVLYDACVDRRDYRAAGPAKPGGQP